MRRILLLAVVVVMIAVGASAVEAQAAFTFDADAEGWVFHPTESFSVTWAAGEGLGGGGALAVAPTSPRTSFAVYHLFDPAWPAVPPTFFDRIGFDIRFASGPSLDPTRTGWRTEDASDNLSAVYMADSVTDIGGGWFHVELTPTALGSLPGTAAVPPGMNLHIETSTATPGTMFIDNIVGIEAEAALSVPVSSPCGLAILAALLVVGGILLASRRAEGLVSTKGF